MNLETNHDLICKKITYDYPMIGAMKLRHGGGLLETHPPSSRTDLHLAMVDKTSF